MEKINIAEILKDCPQGMELYSPIFGKCKFECISNIENQIVIRKNNNTYKFTEDGKYLYLDGECVLFPSKEQRDWSKFQRPFKDGDILYIKAAFDWICIYKESEDTENVYNYVAVLMQLNATNLFRDECCLCCRGDISEIRLATEEEKQKLFKAIKDYGYRWNSETKTLEKVVTYKFDITTLKPFDKVLTRANDNDSWVCNLYSHRMKDYYVVLNAELAKQCVPYEGNEHLLDTSNDCDDFYKTW